MGATTNTTLADYLVSIRTKKNKDRRLYRYNLFKPTFHNEVKPQRRSLAQEIWSATSNQNNKRRVRATIDTTRTKRRKTVASTESTTSKRRNTDDSIPSSERLQEDEHQISKPCTLQPHFTKQEEYGHQLVQYRFEFSRDLLDEISLNDNAESCSESSVISQITQDSSLEEDDEEEEEQDYYSYSSEDDEESAEDEEDDGEESSQSSTSTYHHLESTKQEVKTAEVKEGAQLLLDLLMQ